MAKSILQEDKSYCFICGKNARATYYGLDEHHCFFGCSNRAKSEKYGLKIYICHDTCHLNGVHKDAEINREVKQQAQRKAMEHYGWSVEDFIKIFGKNYL